MTTLGKSQLVAGTGQHIKLTRNMSTNSGPISISFKLRYNSKIGGTEIYRAPNIWYRNASGTVMRRVEFMDGGVQVMNASAGGVVTNSWATGYGVPIGVDKTVTMTVNGTNVSVAINGVTQLSYTDTSCVVSEISFASYSADVTYWDITGSVTENFSSYAFTIYTDGSTFGNWSVSAPNNGSVTLSAIGQPGKVQLVAGADRHIKLTRNMNTNSGPISISFKLRYNSKIGGTEIYRAPSIWYRNASGNVSRCVYFMDGGVQAQNAASGSVLFQNWQTGYGVPIGSEKTVTISVNGTAVSIAIDGVTQLSYTDTACVVSDFSLACFSADVTYWDVIGSVTDNFSAYTMTTYTDGGTFGNWSVSAPNNGSVTISAISPTDIIVAPNGAQITTTVGTATAIGNIHPDTRPYKLNTVYDQAGETWVRTHNDEFTGTQLSSAWTVEAFARTQPWSSPLTNAPVNYDLSNGRLRVWPQALGTGQDFFNRVFTYSSSYSQIGRGSYFEFAAKMPKGKGLWGGCWLKDPSKGVYINLAEIYGNVDQGYIDASDGSVIKYRAIAKDGGAHSDYVHDVTNSTLSMDVHKYGVEMTDTNTYFYLDDALVGSTDWAAPADANLQLVVNLGFGDQVNGTAASQLATNPLAGSGAYSSTNQITPQGNSNAMEIDWVRIFQIQSIAQPTYIVEFYGDSICWGYDGANPGQQVADTIEEQLAAAIGNTVVNKGCNSTTFADLLAGDEKNGTPNLWPGTWSQMMNGTNGVPKSPADVVCILGTHQGSSLQAATMEEVIYTAQRAGKKVIVISPNPNWNWDTTANTTVMRQAADKWYAGYIGVDEHIRSLNLNLNNYVPDGVHPNQALYTIMADYIKTNWQATYEASTGDGYRHKGDDEAPYPNAVKNLRTWTRVFTEDFKGGNFANPSIWKNTVATRPDDYIFHSYATTITYPTNWSITDNTPVSGLAVPETTGSGYLNIWPNSYDSWFMRHFCTDPAITTGINGGSSWEHTRTSTGHGYYEARLRLPVGRGCWPAWWIFDTTGHGWGGSGVDPFNLYYDQEYDIMEAYNNPDGSWAKSNVNPTYPLGYAVNRHPGSSDGNKTKDILGFMENLHTSYHVYGVHVTADYADFYFDNQFVYRRYGRQNSVPLHPRINLTYGGAATEPNTSETPQGPGNSFSIDYIRIWE